MRKLISALLRKIMKTLPILFFTNKCAVIVKTQVGMWYGFPMKDSFIPGTSFIIAKSRSSARSLLRVI